MKSFKSNAWMLPQPVLIIGTYDKDGRPNAMNAAWGGQWDMHEIMISLGSHQTTDNLAVNPVYQDLMAKYENPIEHGTGSDEGTLEQRHNPPRGGTNE